MIELPERVTQCPVGTLMTERPVTVESTTTVARARELLSEFGFRALPVVDDGRVVGIISASDLVEADRAVGDTPPTVASIMSRDVARVSATTCAGDAARAMRSHSVRHLLVDGAAGELPGILSTRDLCGAFGDTPVGLSIEQIAKSDLATVSPDERLSQIRHYVRPGGVHAVLVVGEGRLLGAVGQLDLLCCPSAGDTPASELMDSALWIAEGADDVSVAATRFSDANVSHGVLVDEQGRGRAIVTPTDLVELLAASAPHA